MEVTGYKYANEQDAINARELVDTYYGIPVSPDSVTKNWIDYQNKGPRTPTIQNVGLLAQEEYDPTSQDYFLVLQEDGSGIYVTALV